MHTCAERAASTESRGTDKRIAATRVNCIDREVEEVGAML